MSSIFAFRRESIDYRLLEAMAPGDAARVRNAATFVIVEFGSESEGDDEDDGTCSQI
jgi:hypothetical protein